MKNLFENILLIALLLLASLFYYRPKLSSQATIIIFLLLISLVLGVMGAYKQSESHVLPITATSIK